MTIAIDLMGGDRGPIEILMGALRSRASNGPDLILVGDKKLLSQELKKVSKHTSFSFVNSSDAVRMDDEIFKALKGRNDTSIGRAFGLLSEGSADAVVSAGSSGATVGWGLHLLGPVSDIRRPALLSEFPHAKGTGVILDIGASVDCDETNLVQFALMGAAYARVVLRSRKPRVALLSNGSEDMKGNRAVNRAHLALKNAKGFGYEGHIEGNLLFNGKADVIVCDGFVGNILLKATEGIVGTMLRLYGHRTGGIKGKGSGRVAKTGQIARFLAGIDPSRHGGALLLGMNGICIICHGNADAQTISNALSKAQRFVRMRFMERFSAEYDRLRGVNS